jgi:hypothetical protein
VKRGFRLIWLAPLLALIALGGWVFASPAGGSPDDDYHLVSIWCAAGDRTELCEESGHPETRVVSRELIDIACFAREATESAACQYDVLDGDSAMVETKRGNFVGAYPPVYYAVMSIFASGDVLTSILVMRFVNVLLFLGLTTALYLLLPARRRPTLLWGWLISIVPLGAFLIASNNPSSWAVIGIGSLFLALLGSVESTGRRRLGLGGLAVLSAVMAAGARADAAVYAIFVVAAVVVLTAVRRREYLRQLIVPSLVVLVALGSLLLSAQILSGLNGFGGTALGVPTGGRGFSVAALADGDLLGLLVNNILNTPSLWAGVYGYWALGWFDTPLPEIVAWGGVGVFAAACFTGFHDLTWRKLTVMAATVGALWVIPVFTLTRGGDPVGVEVQPRYILPLIIVLGMAALLTTGERTRWFTRIQTILIMVVLGGTFSVSLYYNMRRYITGNDGSGADLGAGAEWWWTGMPNPTIVCAIAVLAWIGMLVTLWRELRRPNVVAAVDELAPVPSAR